MTLATSGIARRQTATVDVDGVPVGSDHPVVVQSMTNTDTADPDATAIQVARLAHAGSELVRVTVNTEEAAAAVPEMVRKVRGLGDFPVMLKGHVTRNAIVDWSYGRDGVSACFSSMFG